MSLGVASVTVVADFAAFRAQVEAGVASVLPSLDALKVAVTEAFNGAKLDLGAASTGTGALVGKMAEEGRAGGLAYSEGFTTMVDEGFRTLDYAMMENTAALIGTIETEMAAASATISKSVSAGVSRGMAGGAAKGEITAAGAASGGGFMSGFMGKLKGQGTSIGPMIGLTAALLVPESLKMAGAFQASMTRISTLAAVPQSTIKSLSNSVLNLSGQVGFGPKSLAESLYHVESNMSGMIGKAHGFTSQAAEQAAAMEAVRVSAEGAKIGSADLVDVTNALGAVIATGTVKTGDYDKAMQVLLRTVGSGDMTMQNLATAMSTGVVSVATTYGVSLTSIGAALATFGDNNIRGATAATQLRMSLRDLGSQTKTQAAGLLHYGIVQGQLANDMRHGGIVKAIGDLKQHLDAAGVSTNQYGSILTQIFTKRGGQGLSVLLTQYDRLVGKQREIGDSTQTLAQAWAARMKTMSQAVDNVKASLEAWLVRLGNQLMPLVTIALKKMNDGFAWLGKHPEVGNALKVAALGIGAVAAAMGAVALLSVVFSPLIAGGALLGTTFYQLWQHSDAFRSAVSSLWDSIRKLAAELVTNLMPVLRNFLIPAFGMLVISVAFVASKLASLFAYIAGNKAIVAGFAVGITAVATAFVVGRAAIAGWAILTTLYGAIETIGVAMYFLATGAMTASEAFIALAASLSITPLGLAAIAIGVVAASVTALVVAFNNNSQPSASFIADQKVINSALYSSKDAAAAATTGVVDYGNALDVASGKITKATEKIARMDAAKALSSMPNMTRDMAFAGVSINQMIDGMVGKSSVAVNKIKLAYQNTANDLKARAAADSKELQALENKYNVQTDKKGRVLVDAGHAAPSAAVMATMARLTAERNKDSAAAKHQATMLDELSHILNSSTSSLDKSSSSMQKINEITAATSGAFDNLKGKVNGTNETIAHRLNVSLPMLGFTLKSAGKDTATLSKYFEGLHLTSAQAKTALGDMGQKGAFAAGVLRKMAADAAAAAAGNKKVGDTAKTAAGDVGKASSTAASGARGLWGTFAKTTGTQISTAMKAASTQLSSGTTGLFAQLRTSLGKMNTTPISLAPLMNKVKSQLATLSTTAATAATTAGTATAKHYSDAVSTGSVAMGTATHTFLTAFTTSASKIGQTPVSLAPFQAKVTTQLTTVGAVAHGKALTAGNQTAQGYVSGIASSANIGAAFAAGAKLAAAAIRGIHSKAVIASPSKVTYQAGIWMGKGLELGLLSTTPALVAGAQNTVSEWVSTGIVATLSQSGAAINLALGDLMATMAKHGETGAEALVTSYTDSLAPLGKAFDAVSTKLLVAQKTLTKQLSTDAQSEVTKVADIYATSPFSSSSSDPAQSANDVIRNLVTQAQAALKMQQAVLQLKTLGLNSKTLDQIAGDGSSLSAAQSLAAGGASAVAAVNSAQAALDETSQSLGNITAMAMYGGGKAATKGLIDSLTAQQSALQAKINVLGNSLVGAVGQSIDSMAGTVPNGLATTALYQQMHLNSPNAPASAQTVNVTITASSAKDFTSIGQFLTAINAAPNVARTTARSGSTTA